MNSIRQIDPTFPSGMNTPLRVNSLSTEPNAGKATYFRTLEEKETATTTKVTKKEDKKRNKKKWKKPKGKPNRPLSAYNLFFRQQRADMLGDDKPSAMMELLKKRVHCKTHGKIGFAEMAREIGRKWKALDPEAKAVFDAMGKKEKERYVVELSKWKQAQRENALGALDVMATAAVASEPIKDTEASVDKDVHVQEVEPHAVQSDSSVRTRSTLEPNARTLYKSQVAGHSKHLSPPSMSPTYGSGSYYERLALHRLPIISQERLILEQLYFAQSPAFEADQYFQLQDHLAYISQAHRRHHQLLAGMYHS